MEFSEFIMRWLVSTQALLLAFWYSIEKDFIAEEFSVGIFRALSG
jgi:hypothetical protein